MNERQNTLLKILTRYYIDTAEPVSSKYIADIGKFDLSSATIRNEMAELENQGFIYHPHTSAGRVPTEKGYKYFVDNFMEDTSLPKKYQDALNKVFDSNKQLASQDIKNLAKNLADISNGAVFVGFADNDFYYTGLSNLFAQPEFIDHRLVYHLSKVVDHLDLIIGKIFPKVDHDVQISVGQDNPFSQDCSTVLVKYKNKDHEGILGILGPTRMDYQNNFNLIKHSYNLINNI